MACQVRVFIRLHSFPPKTLKISSLEEFDQLINIQPNWSCRPGRRSCCKNFTCRCNLFGTNCRCVKYPWAMCFGGRLAICSQYWATFSQYLPNLFTIFARYVHSCRKLKPKNSNADQQLDGWDARIFNPIIKNAVLDAWGWAFSRGTAEPVNWHWKHKISTFYMGVHMTLYLYSIWVHICTLYESICQYLYSCC